jgi:CubicO group peptidase (beta-lactamase class C family)
VRRGVAAAVLILLACGGASGPEPLRSPLAIDKPIEKVVTNLVSLIPRRMDASGVPGVSVALVRDGEVAWTRGFGLTNVLTDEPVTPDTVFEVASNSKAVAAYAALALVRSGRLSLDGSLNDSISEPFLPESDQRDEVTLRRVLTHTSGLSNLLVGLRIDRRIYFPPGDRFSYSGHGFMYLQETIESVTDQPFGPYVERAVLGPLGMRSSGFGLDRVGDHASGHLSAATLLLTFAALFVLSGLFVWPLAWIRPRFRRPRAILAVNGGVAALSMFGLLGPSAMAGIGVGFVAGVTALAAVVLRFARTPGPLPRLAIAAALFLGAYLVTRPAVPIPVNEHDYLAAGGLRATAPDLARFLVHGMGVREMYAPQVRVNDHVSWGLGIGLQHSDAGDAIWHWGQNPGWESLMVGYPEHRMGVVVLTNGGPPLAGLELAREIAHEALGGEHYGYWSEVPGTFLPAEDEEGE